MKVEIKPITSPMTPQYVLGKLRQAEKDEFDALGASTDQIVGMTGNSPIRFAALLNNEPVFCFGASPTFSHVVHVWGYGTDKAVRVLPEMTRFIRNELIKNLSKAGITRAEVRVSEHNTDSINWFEKYLKATRECELKDMGRDGSRFIQYSWQITDHFEEFGHKTIDLVAEEQE